MKVEEILKSKKERSREEPQNPLDWLLRKVRRGREGNLCSLDPFDDPRDQRNSKSPPLIYHNLMFNEGGKR